MFEKASSFWASNRQTYRERNEREREREREREGERLAMPNAGGLSLRGFWSGTEPMGV